jgi:hypothetical protein
VRYQAALRPDDGIKYIIAANIWYWNAVILSDQAILALYFEPATGNSTPYRNNKKYKKSCIFLNLVIILVHSFM